MMLPKITRELALMPGDVAAQLKYAARGCMCQR
jgi:hypothetical protein